MDWLPCNPHQFSCNGRQEALLAVIVDMAAIDHRASRRAVLIDQRRANRQAQV